MSTKFFETSKIGNVICENIKDENVVFVFSTDICCSTWAEWTVINSEQTAVKTVSLDRFIAWDDFKRQFVVAKEKNKHSVPSLLRKFFVHNIIQKNIEAAKNGEPLFKSIINPVFADEGHSYMEWISSNLSPLNNWHKRFEEATKNHPELIDDEDKDYELLYKEYSKFLGDSMFEPSWITPDFSDSNKKFIIFYPEQFSDFEEYEPVLKDEASVTLIKLKKSDTKPLVYKFEDARKELRIAVLYIRNLVEKSGGKITYDQVAFHAPELESYLPYVKREFQKYCIPFVIRSGKSYTRNSAGTIFENIKTCKDETFSYSSVRGLLLNAYIPWKEKILNENLIREGCDLHCICNYKESRADDVWIKALSNKKEDYREKIYYSDLRKAVECMCDAKTFADIKIAWLKFKTDFLIDDDFSQDANNVLSSCIVLLDELIALEEEYVAPLGLKINDPYGFFISELRNKTYTPQQQMTGVNIFDYKVAACSAFKYNVVINCSQSAVSITKKQLSFLNNQKRKLLGIKDSDISSDVYIELYAKSNDVQYKNTLFFYSEESFDGFAIPHNYFEVAKLNLEEFEKSDFIKNERLWFKSQSSQTEPDAISVNQKNQFEAWAKTADFSKLPQDDSKIPEPLQQCIDYYLNEKRSHNDEGYLKITQTDLKNFFPCSRKWLLGSILKLKEDSLDAELLDKYAQGTIVHDVMDLLFKDFKERYQKVPVYNGTDFGELQSEIEQLINEKIDEAIKNSKKNYSDSPLAYDILKSEKSLFFTKVMDYLERFCATDSNKSFGGYHIVDTEKWFATKYEDKDYGLCGKLDCILSDDDGNVTIVDYKTGSVPAINQCIKNDDFNTLGDFQCATYVELYNTHKDNSVKVSKMIFSKVGTDPVADKMIVSEIKSGNSVTPEQYEPTLDVLREYTDFCADRIKSMNFVPVKDPSSRFENLNVYSDCSACSYKAICRTIFTVGGHTVGEVK